MITIRSGKFKNKKLVTPENGVRPTSDKIRQAIFNILAHNDFGFELDGARVLDAFAGTGAMGLEALSRGAARVWLMEKNTEILKILKENSKIAGTDAEVISADATAPPRAPAVMDLVSLDPPYGENLLPRALSALHAAGWIDEKTLCVCESDADEDLSLPENFKTLDERKYGRTRIIFVKQK